MLRRAISSGVSLTAADAAVATGMLFRGDRQHDIASWFGVNSGRIAEIATGHRSARWSQRHGTSCLRKVLTHTPGKLWLPSKP